MSDETIVAVYDTAAHAEAAVADLIAAKVPQSAISRHAGTGTGTSTGMGSSSGMGAAVGAGTSPGMGTGLGAAQPREEGFWASLFGGNSATDATVYDRSMDTGSSVVVVKAPASEVDAVTAILERHSPIDIDERATGYGLGATAATTTTTTTTAPVMPMPTAKPAMGAAVTGDADKIQLAEESLSVGKRLVNRGGTRIRRYVVETPVEQNVTLHDEKVTLERRPVTDGRALQDANFTEKTIEMTQTGEEAVVGKTARVVEEVSLRKEATERVETVRDTVRKEQVEVVQIPADATIKPILPKV